MRIRVYLDRTDHLWRVCGVRRGTAGKAEVAARVQEWRLGCGYPTWHEAMAAAGRMEARTHRMHAENAVGVWVDAR